MLKLYYDKYNIKDNYVIQIKGDDLNIDSNWRGIMADNLEIPDLRLSVKLQ